MPPRWGTDFDPDRLAALETRMWKAYYRRQPARLFVTLIDALREQARVSWPRALAASLLLTQAAAGFARATGDYERFAPDIARGYRLLGLPDHVDAEAVARHELRWWVVRREIGLAAGAAAGESITDLYAALYDVPRERVAEAGRLRGLAAEIRDRGATDDPDGPRGCRQRLLAGGRAAAARLVPQPRDRARGRSRRARVGTSPRRGLRLAVVRATADQPPGGREDAGRDGQLGRVPDEERRQALGDRGIDGVMPVTTLSQGRPMA